MKMSELKNVSSNSHGVIYLSEPIEMHKPRKAHEVSYSTAEIFAQALAAYGADLESDLPHEKWDLEEVLKKYSKWDFAEDEENQDELFNYISTFIDKNLDISEPHYCALCHRWYCEDDDNEAGCKQWSHYDNICTWCENEL